MNMRRQLSHYLLMLVAVTLVTSCGGATESVGAPVGNISSANTPSSLTITPSAPLNLTVGASKTLSASVSNALGQVIGGAAVSWSSTDVSIASVSGGVVSALAPGTVTVTATSGVASASVNVTVTPSSVATVTVSISIGSLPAGSMTTATVALADAAGLPLTGRVVAWGTSNSAVAAVSSGGTITAVAAGTCTITATSEGKSGSATLVVAAASTQGSSATLPLVYLNTAAPAAPDVGGSVVTVGAGGNLQAALNAAQPGDVIALANGATYTGNFTLPNKNTSSTRWITIRPQTTTLLPAEGSRMTPTAALAANLPLIRTTNGTGAIATAASAHHFRLIGLEVTFTAAVAVENFGLVLLGDGSTAQNSLALVPHDLVLDRMYIHGTSTAEVRRCVALNSASSAVIDSYLSDCHETQSDAQAIMGWNGPGPFKIVNNYLEGSAENLLFGGADPAVPNLIPSDIEVRHNHFSKPVAWKGGPWIVKNLFESKNAQRVLVEGNLMENNWAAAQTGVAVALKSVNQTNSCPWCSSQDITMRYNLIRNVGGGFSLAAAPDNTNQTNVHGRRFNITDNVVTDINMGIFTGDGDGFQLNDDISDITIAHNSVFSPTKSSLVFNGPRPTVRMTIRDNLLGGGVYPLQGRNTGSGLLTVTTYMPDGSFLANVMIVGSSAGYPTSNFYPATIAAVGLRNAAVNDYHLLSTSPYKGRASDGRDPGADIDAVNAAIAGVVVP